MKAAPGETTAHLDGLAGLFAGDIDGFEAAQRTGSRIASFAGFAVHHQVAVPLLRRLDRQGFLERLPKALTERLRRRDSLQRERTSRLVDLLGALRDELDSRDLDFLVLKGPALARRLYGELDGRESFDLDILVRAEDAPRASAGLRRLGFSTRTGRAAPLGSGFVHAVDFQSPSGVVDLHWAIDRHPSLRIDLEQLWDGGRREKVGEVEVRTPGDRSEILVACLGVVRDGERGRLKLKGLLDLHQWIERGAAGPEFLASARAQRAGRPCERALALALAAFGASRDERAKSPTALPIVPVQEARAALPWLLAGRPSWRARRWAFSSWETSPAANAAWWLISLPFRLAVHGRQRPRGDPRSLRGAR